MRKKIFCPNCGQQIKVKKHLQNVCDNCGVIFIAAIFDKSQFKQYREA